MMWAMIGGPTISIPAWETVEITLLPLPLQLNAVIIQCRDTTLSCHNYTKPDADYVIILHSAAVKTSWLTSIIPVANWQSWMSCITLYLALYILHGLQTPAKITTLVGGISAALGVLHHTPSAAEMGGVWVRGCLDNALVRYNPYSPGIYIEV